MKYKIDASLLNTALTIAAKQFYADAEACGRSGDRRSMAGFIQQADQIEALREEIEGDGPLLVGPEWAFAHKHKSDTRKTQDLAKSLRERTCCMHCREYQNDHADGVKCPFASTLFKPEHT